MKKYTYVISCRIRNGLLAMLLLSGFSITSAALGADVKGSKDHPLVSRYEGSYIKRYKFDNFNEYPLVINSIKVAGGLSKNSDSVMGLEGKLTRLMYIGPPKRSTLEVYRNYEKALTDEGFEILFSCKSETCGGYNFQVTIGEDSWMSKDNQRYLAAKLSRDEGDVYVSLYVSSSRKNSSQGVFTQLHVIEIEAMQENMVTVDADAMSKGIGEEGRIALYGILFDVNKAVIKPESKSTLEQISTLLNNNPDLKLVIVGHTDNQGKIDYNMDLSTRRAKSVEAALVKDYGIAKDRLSAWGVGYLSPVATNRSEAGRMKNRRVELVEE